MPIAFDTTGFRQLDQKTWQHANGDHVDLTYYDLVPDLPAGLDDLPKLRHDLATFHAEDGCLIEAHVVQLAGVPALLRIIKVPLPNRPAGQAFLCSFTVPKATCSAVLQLIAPEGPVSGMREAALAPEVGFERWIMQHPYAPQVQGKLPFHAGDDPRFDTRFPDHPLSRARAWAHHVVRTARLDPQFAALPPFQPQQPQQAQQQPPLFGANLTTATVGIPIKDFVALQLGDRQTYWRMTDGLLKEKLAQGVMGRSPLTETRFRDMLLIDLQSGQALVPDRYTTNGAMTGSSTRLEPVTLQEADAAITDQDIFEAYRWVGRMIDVAADRREYLTLEPLEHEGEPRDPYALMAIQRREGELVVVASCSPTPSPNTQFRGNPGLNAPVSPETIEGIGVAVLSAMNEWNSHPLRMALTFNRYPDA